MVQNNCIADALSMIPLTEEQHCLLLKNFKNDLLESCKQGPADPDGKWLKEWKRDNISFFKGKKLSKDHKTKKSKSMKTYYSSSAGIKRNKMMSDNYKQRGLRPPPNKHTKGTFWWNNGIINVRAAKKPGDNFTSGRISWADKNNVV